MSLQDELRKAVAEKNTYKAQDLLDRIARQYFQNSMFRIYGTKK